MSKAETTDKELDMRPYYDFSGGVRGKYVRWFAGTCKVVELEPDVAAPDTLRVPVSRKAVVGQEVASDRCPPFLEASIRVRARKRAR